MILNRTSRKEQESGKNLNNTPKIYQGGDITWKTKKY